MTWKKFTIETLAEGEEIVTALLAECDIYSIEIEDNVPLTEEEKAGMFVDIAPARDNDGTARVSFYIDEDEDWKAKLTEVQKALEEAKAWAGAMLGDVKITTSDTADEDWINNWKQYFKQFYIDDILFTPSWEEDEAQDKAGLVIHIDPGTAFGTGKHETTQLCIRALREYIKGGERLLDVGTGSGVLAMLAFKFGIASAFATDLDPCAVPAVKDNFEKNDLVDADFKLTIGNIIDDKAVQDEAGYECYDIAVANILADVLIPLTPVVAGTVKKGGYYITSGIIEGREGDVAKAMEDAGFKVLAANALGEWRCVIGQKQ